MRFTTASSLLVACLVGCSESFAPTTGRPTSKSLSPNHESFSPARPSSTSSLFEKKKSSGVGESMRNKLLAETIAPWRAVRLFLYGSLGSGALVGGLIQLSSTAAALSGVKGADVDMNTEYLNLAIDFGAVAAFALLAKFDFDKQAELDQRVEEKVQQKKEQRKIAKGMQERAQILGTLKVNVQISADGTTREASVREIQAGARQHMIIVAGPKKACRDALVGANLLKMDFAMSNVLVVPYETDAVASLPTAEGFGEKPIYEKQPYVARPSGDLDAWSDYIDSEMKDAVKQNGDKAKEEGIVIVLANNGKIIRRGVGKVPWRQMVEELDASVSGKTTENSFF